MIRLYFAGGSDTRQVWDYVRCFTLPAVKRAAVAYRQTVAFHRLREMPPADLPSLEEQLARGGSAILTLEPAQDINAYALSLADTLITALTPYWRTAGELPPMVCLERSLEDYLEQENRRFCGTEEVIDRLLTRLSEGDRLLYVQGPSGCGKTTLCGRLTARLEQQGYGVLPVVVGHTEAITSSMDVARYLVWKLEIQLQVESRFTAYLTGSSNTPEPEGKEWCDRLSELCRLHLDTHMPLVVVLDGIDHLFPDDDRAALRFLPPLLGESLRVVVTGDGSVAVPGTVCRIDPLGRDALCAMAQEMLTRDGRHLPDEQVREVAALSVEEGAAAPLYLTLALQVLYLTPPAERTAEGLPRSIEELATRLFTHLQERLRIPSLGKALCLLALSEYGLPDTVLFAIADLTDADMRGLYRCLYALAPCLTEREDGRYRLAHARIRGALTSACGSEVHALLAELMGDRNAYRQPYYHEAAWHYARARDLPGMSIYLLSLQVRSSEETRNRAARHVVRVCLRDGGKWLEGFPALEPMSAARVLQFFLGRCVPRFPASVRAQRLLFTILQGLFDTMRRENSPNLTRLGPLTEAIIRVIPRAFDGEEARRLSAYYSYAFYRIMREKHIEKETLRGHHAVRDGWMHYAAALLPGTMRRGMLEALAQEYSPSVSCEAGLCLWREGEKTLDRVLALRKRICELWDNHAAMLYRLKTYAEWVQHLLTQGVVPDEGDRRRALDLRDLATDPEQTALTYGDRQWAKALARMVLAPQDAAAAHAYTATALCRYDFEDTEAVFRTLSDAVQREYDLLCSAKEITLSLPQLLLAMEQGGMHPEELCRIKSRAPLLLRLRRLPTEGTLRQRLLRAKAQVLLYRLDDGADTAIYDTLAALLADCRTDRRQQEVLELITRLLPLTRDRLLANASTYRQKAKACAAFLGLLCRLWQGSEPPVDVPPLLAETYARWALIAAEGLAAPLAHRWWRPGKAALHKQRAHLWSYVCEVTEPLPLSGEVARLRLDLPTVSAETCREVMHCGTTPADRLRAGLMYLDRRWGRREELPEERHTLATAAAAGYILTGEHRYYERCEELEPGYIAHWTTEDFPPPAPDPVRPEPLPVAPREGKVTRRMRVVLGAVETADGEEWTWECSATTLTLPKEVCAIRRGAFARAPFLRRLEVPATVTHIDEGVFEDCTRLEELVLPAAFAGRDFDLPPCVHVIFR